MRKRRNAFDRPRRHRRFSPAAFIGVAVSLLVILVGAGVFVFVLPRIGTHAAEADPTPNPDCSLIVPSQPLTATGLATPYQLFATNGKAGPCNEANTAQTAFVQAAIYNPATGAFSVYNPLVVDKGTKPAIQPTVPKLPQGAIVAIWFGFNANNLSLQSSQRNLSQSHCVNGLGKSLFTQFAYCNAPFFFNAVNQGIVAHRVHVPALQTAKDGLPCPTVRDFSIIDQDQSDNVQTKYLTTANGRIAQFTAANQKALANSTVLSNPSDNGLLTNFMDPILGCKSWTAPDIANDGSPVASLALDEIQASMDQRSPVALVPLNDPMTTIAVGDDTKISLLKTDLYRMGVDQIPAYNYQQANGTDYCKNMIKVGIPRLEMDMPMTINAASPDPGAANSLFTFLAQRLQGSYDNLNCKPLLNNMPNPVTTKTDSNGVAISASFSNTAISSLVSCSINGKTFQGCNGTANVNGVDCAFAFDKNADQVKVTCPTK